MTTNNEPTSQGRKRKNSINADTGRPTKHRSSQACNACRGRKIRCDVLTNGSRCTNCRLDDTECIVLPSRRGRRKRASSRESADDIHVANPAAVPSSEQPQYMRPPAPPARSTSERQIRPPVTTTNTATQNAEPTVDGEIPVCVTFDEDFESVDHPTDSTRDGGLPTPEDWTTTSVQPSTRPVNTRSISEITASLPSFITPLPSQTPVEDLTFLAQKGVFAIPDLEMRTEIMRSYVFSINPFMPILDLPAFCAAVLDEQEGSHVSLLLFQAVMFAGLASLDLDVIRRLGFESTKQAREVYFSRVKLLYEFDLGTDDTAVMQALLLMSSWYGKGYQRKDTWHWTGLAYNVALTMGLHREPTSNCGSKETQHFRRRLWWSLFIRDRLLALGTRRLMRIREDSFDVKMLELDDFDIQSFGDSDLSTGLQDMADTARICIEVAKLGLCIGHVLSSQYTTIQTPNDVPHTMMVVPKRGGEDTTNEAKKCDREINEWFQNMSSKLRVPAPGASMKGSLSCYEVHWSVLNMVYFTLINVLHRTQATSSSATPSSASLAQPLGGQKTSRSKVKDAAGNITKLAYTMLRRGQVQFLGLSGVTALLAAALSHMLDIRSADEDVRDANTFRFHQTMQVLQALRSIYVSADAAVSFLASAIRRAGISVPAPEFSMDHPTGSPSQHHWRKPSFASQERPSWTTSDSTQVTGPHQRSSSVFEQPVGSSLVHPATSTFERSSSMSIAPDHDYTSTRGPVQEPIMNDSLFTADGNSFLFDWGNTTNAGESDGLAYDFNADTFGFLQSQFQDF